MNAVSTVTICFWYIFILQLEHTDLRSSLRFPIKILYDLFSSRMPVEWCIFLSYVIWRVYKYLPNDANHEAPLDIIFFLQTPFTVYHFVSISALLLHLPYVYYLPVTSPRLCRLAFFFYFLSLVSTSFLLLPLSFID